MARDEARQRDGCPGGALSGSERGEDFVKAKYESALEDEELSPEVRNTVVQAYASVKTGHDQVRDLKRQAHASH